MTAIFLCGVYIAFINPGKHYEAAPEYWKIIGHFSIRIDLMFYTNIFIFVNFFLDWESDGFFVRSCSLNNTLYVVVRQYINSNKIKLGLNDCSR